MFKAYASHRARRKEAGFLVFQDVVWCRSAAATGDRALALKRLFGNEEALEELFLVHI